MYLKELVAFALSFLHFTVNSLTVNSQLSVTWLNFELLKCFIFLWPLSYIYSSIFRITDRLKPHFIKICIFNQIVMPQVARAGFNSVKSCMDIRGRIWLWPLWQLWWWVGLGGHLHHCRCWFCGTLCTLLAILSVLRVLPPLTVPLFIYTEKVTW